MRVKRGEKSALTVKNKRRERYDDDGLRVRGQPAFVDFPSGFDLNPNFGRLASWIGNLQVVCILIQGSQYSIMGGLQG